MSTFDEPLDADTNISFQENASSNLDVGSPRKNSVEVTDWVYVQPRKGGNDRRYTGHVNLVHGPESRRLRNELADVIKDLLEWASSEQSGRKAIDTDAAE